MTQPDDQSPQNEAAVDEDNGDRSSSPQTASLPIDFCGDAPPNEGDTFSVKVVSVDADNGSMDVVCVPKMKTAARGVGAAVAAMKGNT